MNRVINNKINHNHRPFLNTIRKVFGNIAVSWYQKTTFKKELGHKKAYDEK